jgi:hypothetical protein
VPKLSGPRKDGIFNALPKPLVLTYPSMRPSMLVSRSDTRIALLNSNERTRKFWIFTAQSSLSLSSSTMQLTQFRHNTKLRSLASKHCCRDEPLSLKRRRHRSQNVTALSNVSGKSAVTSQSPKLAHRSIWLDEDTIFYMPQMQQLYHARNMTLSKAAFKI